MYPNLVQISEVLRVHINADDVKKRLPAKRIQVVYVDPSQRKKYDLYNPLQSTKLSKSAKMHQPCQEASQMSFAQAQAHEAYSWSHDVTATAVVTDDKL